MGNFFEKLKSIVVYLVFFGAFAIIFYAIPKEGKFKYQYKKNDIWHSEDLISPTSFPVKRTLEEIEKEKKDIKDRFQPYFRKDINAATDAFTILNQSPQKILKIRDSVSTNSSQDKIIKCYYLLKTVYQKGILDPNSQFSAQGESFVVTLITGNVAEDVPLSNFFTFENAKKYIRNYIGYDSSLRNTIDAEALTGLLKPNISYDKELSTKKLESELNEVSLTEGVVVEGEKIIAQGNIITPEKYQVLESLREEYESKLNNGKNSNFIYIGYSILLVLIILGFAIYIREFNRLLFNSNRDISMIMATITLFIVISAYLVRTSFLNIYIVPFCIVPILVLTFFDIRIAFVSHLITVFIVSMFAPNGFEFLFIQIIAGLAVVIGISRVRYLSHFFITSLAVLVVYYITYLGIKLIQVNSFQEIDFSNLLWFSASFLLTLLAYPLIYAYEKMFGILSDITLVELSDLNKKLLRDLSSKAPGTFQHSIQVANISEAVLNKIGGNSLLARVGALYHDIGKMYAPQYFVENQRDINPHDKLEEKESTRIIINHVYKGIELAKEHHLPKEIISFIRSHHGTSRTEFFYRNFMKKNPDQTLTDKEFRYPGPKPGSKEMAVVMMVDAVEAASRSLRETTEDALEELVDRMVDHKMDDGQFENATISLKEINIAKLVIKNSLKGIYHSRIEYPSISNPN